VPYFRDKKNKIFVIIIMSNPRFKMSFNNLGVSNPQNLATPVVSVPKPIANPRAQSLNSPMIGRVYKARPGCSSCGKKVA